MIFVHLIIIAAVCNFSVYKFIGWNPANSYLFKVINENTRKRCEICSKLTINTTQRRYDNFIVNYEHISHLFLVFLLLARNSNFGEFFQL